MKEISNKPQIRFKGFTDDWEQRKLGKHAKLITKGTTPKDKSGNGDINFIKVENIDNGVILPTSKTTIEEHENYLKRSILKVNDILFSIAGTLGRTAIVPENILPANTNQALAIIRDFDFDTRYLLIFLEGKVVKDYIRKNPTVGAQTNLSLEQVGNLKISSPKIEEQIKLGLFFDSINKTITLHQRKLKEIEELKKTFLNKLFPKNENNIPDYRFTGFTDDWEQRKLSELYIDSGSGGTPTSTNKDYYNGEIPFLSITDISNSDGYIYETEKNITQLGLDNSSAWLVPKDSISLAMYASVGKVAILKVDAATSQAFYNMVFENFDIRNFVFQYLKYMEQTDGWRHLISTGTQANLNALKVKNFKIPISTDIREIKSVSQILITIDYTVTLHQRKIAQLELLKKYLLSNMFV